MPKKINSMPVAAIRKPYLSMEMKENMQKSAIVKIDANLKNHFGSIMMYAD
jgi:hypothetical protein